MMRFAVYCTLNCASCKRFCATRVPAKSTTSSVIDKSLLAAASMLDKLSTFEYTPAETGANCFQDNKKKIKENHTRK